MLVAQDRSGSLVNLLEGLPERKDFFCPACQAPVRLKCGQVIRPHFAHVSLKDCHFFHEQESQEHLSLKAQLYQALVEETPVLVEKVLPEIGQVADVWVGDNLALEVQCSRLPLPRLQERTQAYRETGYQVLWLLGRKLWLDKTMTALHRDFLAFSENMGFYLWELDAQRSLIRLKYLIYEDWQGNAHYQTREFSLKGSLMPILRLPYARQPLTSYQVPVNAQLLAYIQKQLYYQSPTWLARQEVAYQAGDNLLARPLEAYYPQIFPPGVTNPSPQMQTFCQAFTSYYQGQADKTRQTLYPPAYYRAWQQEMSAKSPKI